jgi:uncharacterized SAM-binding protein YcdF (DUF218 family)
MLLYSAITKNKKHKKLFGLLALITLLFFSNPFIAKRVTNAWEESYVNKSSLQNKYEYGILLGGIADYEKDYHRIIFGLTTDRLMQTLDLYYEKRINKIIISGGSGEVFKQEQKEAIIIRDYLIKIGIPSEDILLESQSKNTHENARNVAVLLKNNKQTKILLITSAFHMRRAKACFIKEGFNVDIYPTNKLSDTEFDPSSLIPSADAFNKWHLIIKEIAGYLTYKVVGYL